MNTLVITLLQIILIVICGRAVGLLLERVGQPRVIGEIAAGIVLGPSAFGALLPGAFARVFPADSIATLTSLSQLGLIFFMFLVGSPIPRRRLRRRARSSSSERRSRSLTVCSSAITSSSDSSSH